MIKPSPGVTVGGNERKKTRERAGQFFFTRSLLYSSSPTVSLESLRFPLKVVFYLNRREN